MVAAYGFPPGFVLTPLLWVRLALQTDRVLQRQAAAVLMGAAAALSPDRLGREWADALAADPEEAEEILYRANRERVLAAVRARAGG